VYDINFEPEKLLGIKVTRQNAVCAKNRINGKQGRMDALMNDISPTMSIIHIVTLNVYTVSHNYGNPYEKWNIFVARPHLWLQLGMVKPEIILCETVLNLSTLNTLTYLLTY